jgi:hypothetical protein
MKIYLSGLPARRRIGPARLITGMVLLYAGLTAQLFADTTLVYFPTTISASSSGVVYFGSNWCYDFLPDNGEGGWNAWSCLGQYTEWGGPTTNLQQTIAQQAYPGDGTQEVLYPFRSSDGNIGILQNFDGLTVNPMPGNATPLQPGTDIVGFQYCCGTVGNKQAVIDNVAYVGTDMHVHVLSCTVPCPIWSDVDATAQAGVTSVRYLTHLAAQVSMGYVLAGAQVFYIGSDGHPHKLLLPLITTDCGGEYQQGGCFRYWSRTWTDVDLSVNTLVYVAPAWGTPLAVLSQSEIDHSFYIGTDNHVHQIAKEDIIGASLSLDLDLSYFGAPNAQSQGPLVAQWNSTNGDAAVFYLDGSLNVRSATASASNTTSWSVPPYSLQAYSGAPAAAWDSPLAVNGNYHVFYFDSSGNLEELLGQLENWAYGSLSTQTGSPTPEIW